jgi:hypothetical protein
VILNIPQIDANVGYWQVTAGFLKLNYWDFIYCSLGQFVIFYDITNSHRLGFLQTFSIYRYLDDIGFCGNIAGHENYLIFLKCIRFTSISTFDLRNIILFVPSLLRGLNIQPLYLA